MHYKKLVTLAASKDLLRGLEDSGHIENGFEDLSYRVLIPCPGHSQMGSDQGICPLNREGGIVARSAEINPPSTTNKKVGTTNYSSSTTGEIFDKFGKSRGLRIKDLVDYFAYKSREWDWIHPGVGAQGRAALAKKFKQWLVDGATEEEITGMINSFFAGLSNKEVRYPWKVFISQAQGLWKHQQLQRQVKGDVQDAPGKVRPGNAPVVVGSVRRKLQRRARS